MSAFPFTGSCGAKHPLVRLTRLLEQLFARTASAAFCVTKVPVLQYSVVNPELDPKLLAGSGTGSGTRGYGSGTGLEPYQK
jgi:hypothetical protein